MSLSQPGDGGQLLVAAVGSGAGFFDQSVVLILDWDEDGALGVALNKRFDADLDDALPGWSSLVSPPEVLFAGGPVSPDGAVCLARPARRGEEPLAWRRVFGDIGLLHLDTPTELVRGAYSDLRIFAGYSAWETGQLEDELERGWWIRLPARGEDIFSARPADLWRVILRRQGGQVGLLSTWTAAPELN